jgi:selenocysteine lyase/cysteine desulfurase
VIVPPGKDGLFSLENLEKCIKEYESTTLKIVSVTACSNVTGIQNPVHKIAKVIHKYGGVCFVDYACSAPYVKIDMHPGDKAESLDAIYFSPHKFLGGPGTSGILVFSKDLYHNMIPDCPGGGTVAFTNPWGEHKYFDNIEDREDGGTPGFLQTIKSALAIKLKEQMGTKKIIEREHEIVNQLFKEFERIPNLNILASKHKDRLGVISFYIDDLHYNLGVKLLNDRFGIQTRGGCSCAGTYGHYLLHVDYDTSHELTDEISLGDMSRKPGWIRLSIHPTLTSEEVNYIINGVKELVKNHQEWSKDYLYDKNTNEFSHRSELNNSSTINKWFEF